MKGFSKKEACESKEAFEKIKIREKNCEVPPPGLEPTMPGFEAQCLNRHSTRATDGNKAHLLIIYLH